MKIKNIKAPNVLSQMPFIPRRIYVFSTFRCQSLMLPCSFGGLSSFPNHSSTVFRVLLVSGGDIILPSSRLTSQIPGGRLPGKLIGCLRCSLSQENLRQRFETPLTHDMSYC
jgi:hypothetical protein